MEAKFISAKEDNAENRKLNDIVYQLNNEDHHGTIDINKIGHNKNNLLKKH